MEQVVHVGGQQVGRGHREAVHRGVPAGSEHQVVVTEKLGISFEEVIGFREAVTVHENNGIVTRFKERGDYGVAVAATPGENATVVQGDNPGVAGEVTEWLAVGKYIYPRRLVFG